MERFKCHACAFSFTEADQIWDSVKLTGRCPKCSEPLHELPVLEKPQSIAASAQPGATQVEDQFCSNCGVPAAATAKFCAKCGAVLNTIQATTAPTLPLPNRNADHTAQSQFADRGTRLGVSVSSITSSLKVKKALKITGIILGIVIVLGAASLALFYIMENRSFPIESLEVKDAKLSESSFPVDYQMFRRLRPDYADATDDEIVSAINRTSSGVSSFEMRVTNKELFGVGSIKIRIDVYDKDRNPVDGTYVTLYGNIPPKSTRLLRDRVEINGLPTGWTWSYSIVEAKRPGLFD